MSATQKHKFTLQGQVFFSFQIVKILVPFTLVTHTV